MTEEKRISRRELLKLLAATGGAITASSILPDKWTRPLVETGVLPAHAQISEVDYPALTVRASWDMPEGVVDIDLMVWDPGGTGEQVDYSNPSGPTATHSGDNISYDPARNWEEVTVPEGGAADGVYQVWVHAHEAFDVEVTVEITANGNQTFVVTAPAGTVNAAVAEITYPGGTITSWAGPVLRAASEPEAK